MKKMLVRSQGVFLAALLAAQGCGNRDASSEAGGAPPPPALAGRLVYQRGEGAKSEIWMMDLASYKSRRLTENSVLDEYPRWSPDGREIAFYSERDGTRQVYLMDAEGRNVRKVTGQYPINEDPSWSPDGTRLCFWAQTDKRAPENLFIINRDGTGIVNITHTEKGTRRVPAWSPDGERIAFTSNRFLSHQIYTIDVHGRNERRLTGNPRGACRPRWSPDGRRIAYSDGGYSARRNVDIWEMDPDGGDKKRLTENRGSDYDPAYSPDGRKIIFASDRTGRYELYVMDRDGSHEARLTCHNDYTRYPDWSR
jgi:TolB protein